MDAHGHGLLGSDVRDAVGYLQRIRSGDYLYSAGECAGASDCDADGQVRYRHEQDSGGRYYRHWWSDGLGYGDGQSEEGRADDRSGANFHSDGVGKLEHFRDVGSGHDSWRQLFGGDDQHGGSV